MAKETKPKKESAVVKAAKYDNVVNENAALRKQIDQMSEALQDEVACNEVLDLKNTLLQEKCGLLKEKIELIETKAQADMHQTLGFIKLLLNNSNV